MDTAHKKYVIYKILPICVVLAVTTLLEIQLFRFINAYSVNILYWDQWDLYNPLFNNQNILDIFRWQHGPHRQGIGFVLTYLVLSKTFWSTYAESIFIGVILSGACFLFLALKVRLLGKLGFHDVIIPILCLTLTQYQTIVSIPNVSHSVLPLFFLALISWTFPLRTNRHCSALLILCLLCVFTGFGLFCGIALVPVVLSDYAGTWRASKNHALSGENAESPSSSNLLSHNSLRIIVILTGIILAYVLFLIDYRFMTAARDFHLVHSNVFEYVEFVLLMTGFALGIRGVTLIPLTYVCGGVLLILTTTVYLLSLWRLMNNDSRRAIFMTIAFLSGFSLLYIVFTAYGRISFGIHAGQQSRYITLILPAMIALFFYISTLPRNLLTKTILAGYMTWALAWMILFSLPLSSWTLSAAHTYAIKQSWKNNYLRNGSIAQADEAAGHGIYPAPQATNFQWKLNYLKTHKLNLYSKAE